MMQIGNKLIGRNHPCYIVAEVGINSNGNIQVAKQLIGAAKDVGCNAVKFQKRTLDICVPKHMKDRMKDTPWGRISYMDYKRRLEFDRFEYEELFDFAAMLGIDIFTSVWDIPSAVFMQQFNPVAYKIPSAMFTNKEVIEDVLDLGKPTIISTGGADWAMVCNVLESYRGKPNIAIMQCTAAYPCPDDKLNLKVIPLLKGWFEPWPVGYSGHEIGLATSVAAVVMGADILERHITLDRASWGSDQSASVEPQGFKQMIRDIRAVELAMGDGVKRFEEIEKKSIKSLRWQDD